MPSLKNKERKTMIEIIWFMFGVLVTLAFSWAIGAVITSLVPIGITAAFVGVLILGAIVGTVILGWLWLRKRSKEMEP